MNTLSTKPTESVGPLGSAEKNKQWQRELLMERLRSRSNQHKTFPELSKSMRMSMLEKRYALDAVEKSNLQKCLDSMQHCIKVTTRQGLVERLESLSRQLGLKFMEDTSGLFISSDMFYLEIILDHSGTLSDVKVHHECKIEQQSCSELVTCLLNGDFSDFTVQLEGLSSIYQLNAEPKVKSKAFIALQAMETDIYNLFSIQTFHKDAQLLLLESSVGVVQKRRGGHPMRLTYFVSPYDLLSFETKCIAPLTIDLLTTKNLGMSVTLNLEASSANKIQIAPTVTFNQDSQGSSIPIYSPLTSINSTLLPATFVLRLNKSLPVCESLRQSIVHSSENLFSDSKPTSIMQLIVQTASEGQIQNSSKGLFVSLPDQNHCYFFTESKQMKGYIITNLPFTEPSQVPKILSILRRQARFYTLLASCVRPQGKMMDLDTTTMLEVNATSIYQISVALQHPFEESMATVEFDLNDPINVTCRLYSLTNSFEAISVKLSKIAQKSLSIPVTIRALLKFWEQERMKVFHRGIENGNFNLPLGPTDPGGRGSEIRDMKVKSERGINGSFSSSSRQFFHPSGVMMSSTDTFSENNVNIFTGPNENVMMNQFAMKANNDLNFTDIGAIKNYSAGEDFCRSPKSNIDLNCQNFSETSDSSSLGTSTPSSDSGVAASCFQKTFQTNTNDSSSMNNEIESDKILKNFHVENDNKSNQEIWKDDNENSTQVPANNTLSGIAGMETNSALSGMRSDRHPAVEIIPVTTTASQNVLVSSSVSTLNSNKHDKKSLMKKGEEKSKVDKKRKRKKGDSPMGPPEKLISKQDSLNRQFNNSVKNFEMSPNSPSCLARKYSPGSSPKLNQSNSSKPSPKNSPVYNSPKHLMNSLNSPKSQYGITSPKHGILGSTGKPSMSALKSATNSLSPKSEKCKMSYRDKEKDRSSKSVSSVNSSKIKASTVKLKQIDLSAAFLTHGENSYNDLCLQQNPNEVFKTTSPTGGSNNGLNSNVNNVCKVRKGSLSAVIDKLKSAQNSADDFLCTNLASTQKLSDSEGGLSVTNALNEKSESFYCAKAQLNSGNSGVKANTSSSNPSINSEYQIKPSLDGMKITINKTRSKDASSQKITSPPASKAQTAGNNSPKKLSSLKAGGAASALTKKYSNKTSNSQGQTPQGKGNFQKSNSSGNLAPTKSSSSFTKSLSSNSFSTTDLLKKDKISKAKSANSDRAPSNSKHDPTDVMKILRYASPKSAMEGFMKSLNTKFQIPKLSARAANDDSKKDNRSNSSSAPTNPLGSLTQSPPIPGGNNCNNESAGKSLPENLSKNKYPFSLGKSTSDCVQSNIPSAFGKISNYMSPNAGFLKDLNPLPKSDPILNTTHQKNQIIKPLSSSTPSTPMHMTFPPFTSPHSSVLNSAPTSRNSPQDTSSFQNQSVDVSMRPPSAPCAVDMSKTGELDLSIKSESKLGDIRTVSNVNSVRKVPGHKMSFPPSPSVSLHIVKSPVPSPLMVMPSPHSNSPCITDDELMDEALVGITGK